TRFVSWRHLVDHSEKPMQELPPPRVLQAQDGPVGVGRRSMPDGSQLRTLMLLDVQSGPRGSTRPLHPLRPTSDVEARHGAIPHEGEAPLVPVVLDPKPQGLRLVVQVEDEPVRQLRLLELSRQTPPS